jgi:Protein of unknown function (DUF2550)
MLTVVLELLAALCLLGLCAIGALFTRRVMIRRRGGTFDCSLRLTPMSGAARAAVHSGQDPSRPAAGSAAQSAIAGSATPDDSGPASRGTRMPLTASGVRNGRGWSYGMAQYEADRIDWYRIFSYAFRPAAVLTRRDLQVLGQRDAVGHEELALFPGWTIVECRFGSGLVELAMSPDALTGFLAWLEAAPPGQGYSRVS